MSRGMSTRLAVTRNLWNSTGCPTIPHDYFSTLYRPFWINLPRWPYKKPTTVMCSTKCFAPLGAKALDCITSWDVSTTLEYDNDALWEHLLPCLFRGSWSLLKRKGRQKRERPPRVRCLHCTSLLSVTGAHVLVLRALARQELWKPRWCAACQASRAN